MRRLACVGSLALCMAFIAPTSAASVTSYQATLAQGSVTGTITVSLSGTGGTLTEHLSGLVPRSTAVLWLRAGVCSSSQFGIARVRQTASRTGKVALTVNLTSAMVGYFRLDWSRRGGVHATLTDGATVACARLAART